MTVTFLALRRRLRVPTATIARGMIRTVKRGTMNLNDLQKTKVGRLPENVHLFVGGVEGRFTQQNAARALERGLQKCQGRPGGVVISIVQYRRRALDTHDNLRTAAKPLVDAIAKDLGIDDGDVRIRWE